MASAPGPLAAPPPRPAWRKLVYGALGCLTLVVLIVVAAVAWNARRIAAAFQGGAAFVGELMAVQEKLVTAYRTGDVHVQWVMDPQSPGRRLVVHVTNSPLLKEAKLDEA